MLLLQTTPRKLFFFMFWKLDTSLAKNLVRRKICIKYNASYYEDFHFKQLKIIYAVP
jgi:hypothetical protein